MKKISFIAIVLAMVFAFSFVSGCTNNGTEDPNTTAAPETNNEIEYKQVQQDEKVTMDGVELSIVSTDDAVSIAYGDKTLPMAEYSVLTAAYLVTRMDREWRLLISIGSEGSSTTRVVKVNNGVPEIVEGEYEGFVKSIDTANNTATLEGSVNVLGTWTATRDYQLNTVFGAFKTASDWSIVCDDVEGRVLTVSTEIDAEHYDSEIGLYMSHIIPVGTRVIPTKTDGKAFMVFDALDSEEVYRINFLFYNGSEERTINGKTEEECFTGIAYAG